MHLCGVTHRSAPGWWQTKTRCPCCENAQQFPRGPRRMQMTTAAWCRWAGAEWQHLQEVAVALEAKSGTGGCNKSSGVPLRPKDAMEIVLCAWGWGGGGENEPIGFARMEIQKWWTSRSFTRLGVLMFYLQMLYSNDNKYLLFLFGDTLVLSFCKSGFHFRFCSSCRCDLRAVYILAADSTLLICDKA